MSFPLAYNCTKNPVLQANTCVVIHITFFHKQHSPDVQSTYRLEKTTILSVHFSITRKNNIKKEDF
jgi:hypothetical protein